MTLDSEQRFENDLISWLGNEGWNTYESNDTYGGTKLDNETGRSASDIIHTTLLEDALTKLNPDLSEDEIIKTIEKITAKLRTQDSLVVSNKDFHEMLRSGVTININTPRGPKNRNVTILDLDKPENNRFDAVSQHTYTNKNGQIRPDIALFINGIPVVLGELKGAGQGRTTTNAHSDMQAYESEHDELFYPAIFNIVATQHAIKYGAVGADFTQYNPWKPEDINPDAKQHGHGYNVEESTRSLCKPARLLEFIDDFVFYDVAGVSNSKIVPRHQQYFATKKMFERVEKAKKKGLNHSEGLIWHTQGSGKSFTMYFAARIAATQKNAKSLILVDRKDLREQMGRELQRIEPRFNVEVVDNGHRLKDAIQGGSDIVLTTLQLFDGVKDKLQTKETYIFADEAHRNMEKDYGSHLESAFPPNEPPMVNHFGFTGTPVSDKPRNTFSHYSSDELENESPYLHRYSMESGVDEKTIVPVDIVDKTDTLNWIIDNKTIDNEFMSEYGSETEQEALEFINKHLSVRDIAALSSRTEAIAEDIHEYYKKNVEPRKYSNKAMVVTGSREAAAKIGSKLIDIYSDDEVKVLYTKGENDSHLLKEHYKSSEERKKIREAFKEDDNPKILVVCSMLLTGFDAPVLGTIFMDRKLKGHRLMQAIARANRPNGGKKFGEIVDYWGVSEEINGMYENVDTDITIYVSENKDEFINEFDSQMEQIVSQCDMDKQPHEIAEELYSRRDHDKYMEDFKRLRDLKESIEPDKRLFENSREEHFEQLEQVHKSIHSLENEGDVEEIDKRRLKQRAKESIESGVEVERDSSEGDPDTSLTVDDWLPENMQVRQKKKKLQTVLKKRSAQSPAFKDLSKRVEEIIQEWNHGKSSTETMEELEEVTDELEERTTPNEVDGGEWLEQVMKDVVEVEMDVESIDDNVSNFLVGEFLDVWEERRQMDEEKRKEEITREIKRSMIQQGDLYRELTKSGFADKATEYLVRNMERMEA